MLSPLIRAISSILSRSSTRTKRQGWLLKCEGAIAATSTRRRWCSLLTGSGRNGPFVVLRLLRTCRKSKVSLLKRPHETGGVEDQGGAGERRVAVGTCPNARQHREQREYRQEHPGVGRAL